MKYEIFQDKLNDCFKKFKDRTAIEFGRKCITYSRLEKRTGDIAHWLIMKGFKKETFIGIMAEDRMELTAAIIAVLKAGCVFVPLDTANPDNRLAAMIDMTNIDTILVDRINYSRRVTKQFVNEKNINWIVLEDLTAGEGDPAGANKPAVQYTPEDKIYIYFTSGTTGTPNAVIGKNIALLHFCQWEVETFNIDESYRISQFAAPGFDALLKEVFVSLFAGGTLCIPENLRLIMNPEDLTDWLAAGRINLFHCIPGLFRLIDPVRLTRHHPLSLTDVFFSGETIYPRDLRDWFAAFDESIRFVNLYGATETTILKSYYPIKKSDVNLERIPIGKPIKGARMIVLDEDMNVCNAGVVGEIYIRTRYRTFGYYNSLELTRERFLPNPFTADPDDLIFKTGDLGRFLIDGNIELIGRKDRQVKIRGIRVELEEIESILMKHPLVKEAVVLKEKLSEYNEVLSAYVTGSGENEPDEETFVPILKDWLPHRLPDYIVPGLIVKIDEMPRRPNGKVDYEALISSGKYKRIEYIPPGNAIEQKLVEIWAGILKIEKLGVTNDFFEAGGSSLNVMSLIARIHQEFDVRLTIVEIFNNATIKTQAHLIKNAAKDKFKEIKPVEKKSYYPLSPAQKRLFFLGHVENIGFSYNMASALNAAGKIDKPRFERAVKDVIKRHEALRTSFHLIDNEPVQRIYDEVEFEIEYYHSTAERTEDRIHHFIRSFDLSRAPLLRVRLVTLADDQHLLLYDMHHIVGDGTSSGFLADDFIRLYAGEKPQPLKIQYNDFSNWQNCLFVSGEIKVQEEYWFNLYPGEIPRLNLLTDYPRPAFFSFAGDSFGFTLGSEDASRLEQLGFASGNTLYMNLLAAFNVLLYKYTGQDDIIVGGVIDGRRHADLQHIIGMFVNTLAMRNHPRGDKTFLEFLNEVKENSLKAFENQDVQFEELVDKLDVERDPSRNPLFDVCFVMQNFERPQTDLEKMERVEGVVFSPYAFERKISQFDLTIDAFEIAGEIHFNLEYCTSLFKNETVQGFTRHFINIIKEIGLEPGTRLADIDLMTKEEKRQVLVEFNDTEKDYPKDKTIHRLFEEQAERTPDRIALVGSKLQNSKYKIQKKYKSQIKNNKQSSGALRADFDAYGEAGLKVKSQELIAITYKELNEQSNRLAHYLYVERNIRPGALLGLMMDQSVDGVIAILGILKAGGAYLPIDPDYPQERIDFMLKDSGAKLLVTTENLEELPNFLTSQLPNFPLSSATSLAYLIYTSGSTGKPKGVMVEHRSVVNLVHWFGQTYGLQAGVNLLQLTGYSFDPSVEDIFSALVHGASLVVASRALLVDMVKLREFIRTHQIHIIDFIPALLDELLCGGCGGEKLNSLRVVISGGEKLEDSLKDRFLALGYRLYNHYGPTEITVDALVSECSQDKVTLGVPIANTQCFVLDQYNNPAAPGVPGELCITGIGVARGYLNRPELTAEKFILPSATRGSFINALQNVLKKTKFSRLISYKYHEQILLGCGRRPPFEKSPLDPARLLFNHHSPLYRTGDRCCWLPDGNIRFFGRIDDQIKIRGYRVELQEIENVLKSHKNIKDAVVLTRENKESKAEIYAYYVDGTRISPVVWPSVGEYPLYDDYIYYAMTNDVVRNNSYKAAIGRKVAGKVVVEIGTGKDVILARFCLEAGARIVYAIEISEDSFKKAQQTVKDLGLQDKIVLIHGDAASVEIPEGADICLSELIGTIGGSEGAAAILKIARRFLKENGGMIPDKSITKIAAVQLPLSIHQSPEFSRISSQYVETLYRYSGHPFDFRICIDNFPISNVISSDGVFEYLDFSGPIETEGQSNVELVITKNGRMDGFLLWLNLYTCPGVLIDNLVSRHNWAPVFIPVMYPGIAVSTGDRIRMTCSWGLSRNGINPDYRLEGVLILKDGTEISFQYELPYFETAFRKNPFYRQLLIDNPASYARNIFEYLDQRQLREYLEAHLPSYMMPSHLIELEKIPLTANGKIDKNALPEPAAGSTGKYLPPRNDIEEKLVEIWSQSLGIGKENISINANFFEIGGHSLKSIPVVGEIYREFNVEVPISEFFSRPTIEEIGQYIAAKRVAAAPPVPETVPGFSQRQSALKQLVNEKLKRMKLRVKEAREAAGQSRNEINILLEQKRERYERQIAQEELPDLTAGKEYSHILITGSTGYLGSYLIYELLCNTRARLYLLLRDRTPREAEKRLEQKITFYFGKDFYKTHRKRLEIVPGNLANERMGIEISYYRALARTVEAIVHAAANTRHLGPYEDFYSHNVIGTERVMNFALSGKKKDFHHVSTMSVADGAAVSANGNERCFLFTEYCHRLGYSDSVYVKSKIEAEKKVMAYREKGLNASIYRVGNLIAHFETGKFQESLEGQAFYTLINTFLILGLAPREAGEIDLDLSFIDYVAQAVVLLMLRKHLTNETYHLFNSNSITFKEMIRLLCKAGVNIKTVSLETFLVRLLENRDETRHPGRDIALRFLLHSGILEEGRSWPVIKELSKRTERLLEPLGFRWPPVTGNHLKKMADNFRNM
jgi:amino acid adenylation domain-containing protein/thioester reductase-like protein